MEGILGEDGGRIFLHSEGEPSGSHAAFPIRVLLEIRGCGFFHKGERFLRLSGLGLAMFLSGVPGSSLATPRVALPYIRGFPAATVEVPLALRYGTNDLRDVVGLQADVTFSGGQVEVGPIEPGTAVDNHVIRVSQPVAGTTRFLVFSQNNRVLTNGSVVRLPCTVANNVFENARMTLSNVILARADGTSVPLTAISGGVVIHPVFVHPDGHVDGFFSVLPDVPYVVQATTDFVDWQDLITKSVLGTLLDFEDPAASQHPFRFYRALPAAAQRSGR